MFSASVELLLSVAFREATARRHTHLTLEHLLYVLAHDGEGERILAACGADLPKLRVELDKYLQKNVEQFPRGQQKEPDQTLSFRRVLQTAVLHVQSSGKGEVEAGDLLAAMLQQSRAFAAQLLEAQGITRLDVLNYISHGISKVPHAPEHEDEQDEGRAEGGSGEEGPSHRTRPAGGLRHEPHRARHARPARPADWPHHRVAAHARDPLPAPQEQPRVRRRSRRRQDGDGRGARDAPARRRRPAVAGRRGGVRARHDRAARGHAVPRRLRRAVQGRHLGAGQAPEADPVHRRDPLDGRRGRDHGRHARPGHAHQAGPHGRRTPRGRFHHVRGVQAHREGPRAGAPPAEGRSSRNRRPTRP